METTFKASRKSTKRLAVVMFLWIIVFMGLYVWSSVRNSEQELRQLDEDIRDAELRIDSINADGKITLGKYSNQKVDPYIRNLRRKLDLLRTEIKLTELQIERAIATGRGDNAAELQTKLGSLNTDYERYLLDAVYMSYAWLDYRLLELVPSRKQWLYQTIKDISSRQLAEYIETGEKIFITAGTVIGTQGCTGICSGTHLHLVTSINGELRDPCKLLPQRELSRWGSAGSCGVEVARLKQWPMLMPWLMTQTYGNLSDVTGRVHGAIDLIERVNAPILATHDGWFYTEKRDCTRSRLCKGGAAVVAHVCENKDCKVGLHTEYWHLSWAVFPKPKEVNPIEN